MKTTLAFLVGVLVGAYFNGQIIQQEAIKRGFAVVKNNQFKWKEIK